MYLPDDCDLTRLLGLTTRPTNFAQSANQAQAFQCNSRTPVGRVPRNVESAALRKSCARRRAPRSRAFSERCRTPTVFRRTSRVERCSAGKLCTAAASRFHGVRHALEAFLIHAPYDGQHTHMFITFSGPTSRMNCDASRNGRPSRSPVDRRSP